MATVERIAVRHFGKKNITALRKRGIQVLALTVIPDENGSTASSPTAYMICDNGTAKVRTYGQVVRIAEGKE